METRSENLIAGDIVKISTGLCYFYAGYIPARGHFVKDAQGKTILVPNHEVPILVQRQTQPLIKSGIVTDDSFYPKIRQAGLWPFPHDRTY